MWLTSGQVGSGKWEVWMINRRITGGGSGDGGEGIIEGIVVPRFPR